MDKNKAKINNISNQITDIQEQKESISRGIYLRDDYCDWGSSGMNEYTKEFGEKK
tara:strand:+ start:251 stop:415 length:165 start_codon:yes stop_codon:yes gene_type:complete